MQLVAFKDFQNIKIIFKIVECRRLLSNREQFTLSLQEGWILPLKYKLYRKDEFYPSNINFTGTMNFTPQI